MRQIKFRAWDDANNEMVYSDKEDCFYINTKGALFMYGKKPTKDKVEDYHKDYNLMQYTGIKDKNGIEIYEGDLINIFYESKEYIFDGVYAVRITPYGIVFDFKNLLWESYAYNQFPSEKAKVSDYGFILNDYKNKNSDRRLCVSGSNKYLYSNYFEIIGNIHENPELLESEK